MTRLNEASLRQNQAAEPGSSTWLSANAGSGKTRVLTDRVARLLLDKVAPQNILCLTYTKAAASEMQNRLFERLGSWAMKPDQELIKELGDLGVDLAGSGQQLREARQLFARAIETPGGLRIQTIHSFCASLLRRFPLEAGVSPDFVEMDDRAAALLQNDVVEAMADKIAPQVIDSIAPHLPGTDIESLTKAVIAQRAHFTNLPAFGDVLRWFGLPADFTTATLIDQTFDRQDAKMIQDLIAVLKSSDSSQDQKHALALAQVNMEDPTPEDISKLADVVLTKSGAAPFTAKIGKFPTKASQKVFANQIDALHGLMTRIEDARSKKNSLYSAQKTHSLHRFAHMFLPEYERRKQRAGWLDFDDLILRTRALLSNELVANWVLYRLDGGLDHILVDEAQDTSPAQWNVVEKLAQEFTSGVGARDDVVRTIFVVGDKKQSIYSFQGADPREFDRMRDHFDDRLRASGSQLRAMDLEYSFRSSDAIMRFVDTLISASDMRHRAFHAAMPGRVDLWPVVEKSDAPAKPDWFDPVDILSPEQPPVVLADKIAKQIKWIIETQTIPDNDGKRQRVQAGDILILVRRRSDLFSELIRACKAEGLPVAGADRLKLGAELAVKDLAALLSFLATPEDSLSLAAALKSPLFGWTEAQLYDLAARRQETHLWQALRRRSEEFAQTLEVLTDLRDSADFLRPYDLIERVLTRHGGRHNLLARLGAEAEDGIDVLLGQALAYERSDVPSLTGFLGWLDSDDVEVKRQLDNAGGLVRVMTIHGAKGLESPIVFLPDCNKRNLIVRDELLRAPDGNVYWKVPANNQPAAMEQAMAEARQIQQAEDERLLYVAVTRAETWLIIAAAGDLGKPGESWHGKAQIALADLGAVPQETPTGTGLRYAHADWDGGVLTEADAPAKPVVDLPDWARQRPHPAPEEVKTKSPSQLGGEKALPGEGAQDEASALRWGSMIHLLLEYLPTSDPAEWPVMAANILAGGSLAAEPDEITRALTEAERVLLHPELSHVFAPDVLSEVDVFASIPELNGTPIQGTVDKLLVTSGKVLAIDFKTNAIVPQSPTQVPDGILRQMGAYLSALQQIYPDHAVEIAVLWTKTAELMKLPHEIVRQALQSSATS